DERRPELRSRRFQQIQDLARQMQIPEGILLDDDHPRLERRARADEDSPPLSFPVGRSRRRQRNRLDRGGFPGELAAREFAGDDDAETRRERLRQGGSKELRSPGRVVTAEVKQQPGLGGVDARPPVRERARLTDAGGNHGTGEAGGVTIHRVPYTGRDGSQKIYVLV